MNERESVLILDGDGESLWFDVNDARHWKGTTLEPSELFGIAGRG